MSERRSNEAGFTLVEALVSLFVFSLIAAGSVMMLMQSVDSQRRVAAAHQELRELQTARALLAADMAQLVMRDVRQPGGARSPRFIGGDANQPLAFVRAQAEPDPEQGARTALTLVEYRFVDGAIVRASRADLDSGADEPAMAERVLISEAVNPRFQFFDGVQWTQQWVIAPRGGAAPKAVALVFETPRYGEVRIEAIVGLGA